MNKYQFYIKCNKNKSHSLFLENTYGRVSLLIINQQCVPLSLYLHDQSPTSMLHILEKHHHIACCLIQTYQKKWQNLLISIIEYAQKKNWSLLTLIRFLRRSDTKNFITMGNIISFEDMMRKNTLLQEYPLL